MNSPNRTYLVDTQNLTPEKRAKTEELLGASCWMVAPLAKNLHIYMVHTSCPADEFASIAFPDGCVVSDVTGQNLLAFL